MPKSQASSRSRPGKGRVEPYVPVPAAAPGGAPRNINDALTGSASAPAPKGDGAGASLTAKDNETVITSENHDDIEKIEKDEPVAIVKNDTIIEEAKPLIMRLDRTSGTEKPYFRLNAKAGTDSVYIVEVHGSDWIIVSTMSHQTPAMQKVLQQCRGMVDVEFAKKKLKAYGNSEAAKNFNETNMYSFGSSIGDLYPMYMVAASNYDVPEPVGDTLRSVLCGHLVSRGIPVTVLPEIEPTTFFATPIQISKMVDCTGNDLQKCLDDDDCFLVDDTEDLETIYKQGKAMSKAWFIEKKQKMGSAFNKKKGGGGGSCGGGGGSAAAAV
jgi:hypothetical protein